MLFCIDFRLDKTRFHINGAILFTVQSSLIHPTAVVKTRMQVASSGLAHMSGTSVFRHILKTDGIPGLFRGFGTSAIGALPGRVLALTSLEVSKDMTLKYTEGLNMAETTRVGIANGVAGMFSNLVSCAYFVPLEVVCVLILSFLECLYTCYPMLIITIISVCNFLVACCNDRICRRKKRWYCIKSGNNFILLSIQ
jgi:hypothetical protein